MVGKGSPQTLPGSFADITGEKASSFFLRGSAPGLIITTNFDCETIEGVTGYRVLYRKIY